MYPVLRKINTALLVGIILLLQPLQAFAHVLPAKKIYITPGQWGQLFAIENPIFNRDDCLRVLYQLREVAQDTGYELIQADSLERLEDFEYLIVFDVFPEQISKLKSFPKEKLILFLWEHAFCHAR